MEKKNKIFAGIVISGIQKIRVSFLYTDFQSGLFMQQRKKTSGDKWTGIRVIVLDSQEKRGLQYDLMGGYYH